MKQFNNLQNRISIIIDFKTALVLILKSAVCEKKGKKKLFSLPKYTYDTLDLT